MWTNLSIGAFRFRRVQIEEHRTGGGKMWTNLVHRTLPESLGRPSVASDPNAAELFVASKLRSIALVEGKCGRTGDEPASESSGEHLECGR
jgi:hypothetical protein